MKKNLNIFRVIAVCLSITAFLLGIGITLGIFMPLAGYEQAEYPFFTIGYAVFKVYGFSAFLIPLIFLYASVVLFIPGWSYETASVLLGVPLYFITSFVTERILYGIIRHISIPLIKHFAVSSIIICGLILICVEIFMMIEFSGVILRILKNMLGYEEEHSTDDTEAAVSAELAADVPQPENTPPNADDEVNTGIYQQENTQPDSVDGCVPQSDTESSVPETDASAGTMHEENEIDNTPPILHTADNDAAEQNNEATAPFVVDAVQPAVQTIEVQPLQQIELPDTGSSDEESVSQLPHCIEAADSPACTAKKAIEQTIGQTTIEKSVPEDEKPLPVFDPGDPNNLFNSLEEITADVERIKHTDYPTTSNAQQAENSPPQIAVPAADQAAAQRSAPSAPDAEVSRNVTAAKQKPAAATEAAKAHVTQAVPAAAESPAKPASRLFNLDSAVFSEKVRKAVPTSRYPLLDSLVVIERTLLRGCDIREVPVIPEDTPPKTSGEIYRVSDDALPDAEYGMREAAAGSMAMQEQIPDTPAASAESAQAEEAAPQPAAASVQTAPMPAAPASETAAEQTFGGGHHNTENHSNDSSLMPESLAPRIGSGYLSASEHTAADTLAAGGTYTAENQRTAAAGSMAMQEQLPDTPAASAESAQAEEAAPQPAAASVQTAPMPAAPASETAAEQTFGGGHDNTDHTSAAAFSGNADEYLDESEDESYSDDSDEDDAVFSEKPALNNAATVPVSVPAAPRKKYSVPFDLLNHYPDGEYWIVDDATRKAAFMLKSTFSEFKIDVSITGIKKGPVVTMFEMLPPPGIKLSKITNLQDNIALRLAASSVRIVAPIPGKHAVGIEVPNKKRSIVSFRELIETDLPESAKMAIPVVLGKDVTGNPQLFDLAQTPHLLIAGATGSGKSVCVNTIILSILYNRRPDEVKLILVDPKIVELKLYNDIAHLLAPVITEPKRAFQALQYSLCEMERRYALLDGMGVRDIKTYNKKIKAENIAAEELPYIVIIIDEFADLMATSGKELEATVARLCAMSRAVGIHLVLATQRPSIDVITGLIKANIPTRIAFMVASKTDSRIILDEVGAEKLLGKGDMLYVSAAQPFPSRMQGAFVSEEEVERVVSCVKDYCEPEYIDDEIFVDDDDDSYEHVVFSDDNDPLYDQALEIVTFAGKASASYVQRKLKIGYNRAARLIEEMEANGIVGPANGSKPREILRRP